MCTTNQFNFERDDICTNGKSTTVLHMKIEKPNSKYAPLGERACAKRAVGNQLFDIALPE